MHTVTLGALEVLRLITDRVEREEAADAADIEFVLRYFGEISGEFPDGAVSEMLGELERCHKTGECKQFVEVSRRYTETVIRGLASTPAIRSEGSARQTLHRLEAKYV